MKNIAILLAILLTSFTVWSAAPTVSNVQILGEAAYNGSATTVGSYTVGSFLTGIYDYTDPDDEADESTYQWYRDGVAIAGATSIRYEIVAADEGTDITLEVTAVDASNPTGEVGNTLASSNFKTVSTVTHDNTGTADIIYTSGTHDYLNVVLGNSVKIDLSGGAELTIHGDLDANNGDSIIVRAGSTLNVNGQFITDNNIVVVVEDGAFFNVYSGFTAKNNTVLTVSGNVNIVGDLTVNNNAGLTVNGTGTMDVDGDINFGNGTNTLEVNGTMTVTGDITGSADLSGTGSLTVDGTIGGDITDTTGGSVLPIELVFFEAKASSNGVNLTWQTASEKNNDFFTIERSVDGISFLAISTVSAIGTSYNPLNYSYFDESPVSGIFYYRLRQTDYNGESTTFAIITVNVNAGDSTSSVSVKNINNRILVDLGQVYDNIHYLIADANGNIVDKQLLGTTDAININMTTNPLGIYIIMINNNKGFFYSHKLKF